MSYKIYYNLEGAGDDEVYSVSNKDEVILELMRQLAQFEPDTLRVVWPDGSSASYGGFE